MASATALVIMARYPEVGAVKTRLARTIGAERARDLYAAFLHDLDTRFAHHQRTLVWAHDPPNCDFAAIVTPGARCVPQVGRDLGERMRHAFRQRCREFERVLMIGADAPHVRDEWLDEAEHALDDADVVLGPSHDGGYYLIAMRRPHDVFTGIEMSTSDVLTKTRRSAEAQKLRVHLLPPTFDIDDASDLDRLRNLLQREDLAASLPATAGVLREWV